MPTRMGSVMRVLRSADLRMLPGKSSSSGLRFLLELLRFRCDKADDTIRGGPGARVADGVEGIRGVKDDRAWADTGPLAFAEGFDRPLVDDDDFFVGVLVWRMGLLAWFQSCGVDFKLIECGCWCAEELSGLANVGFGHGDRIPVINNPAEDGGFLIGEGEGAAGSEDREECDDEVATGEQFHSTAPGREMEKDHYALARWVCRSAMIREANNID